MKSILGLLFLTFAAPSLASFCHVTPPADNNSEWVTMSDQCKSSVRQQIQMEVKASLSYLALGAHFSRDKINRPGFAKLFFEAATEEREHAMKLIEYLLMRGELTSRVTELIEVKSPEKIVPRTGADAITEALKMESKVTNSIREVIKKCEGDDKFNDYHLVDYLTGDFLEEQYKGQRDLAGKASTLKTMILKYQALGEFLFDKKLLGIDI